MSRLPDDRLRETLSRVPRELYAVVDGAFFSNLRVALQSASLEGRPLYRDEEASTASSAGPHIVHLPDEAARERLLGVLDGKAAAVFWSWPGDAESIYRHLRKIGMVEIPAREVGSDQPFHEVVLFRHADPHVMAATLGVLHIDQYANVFGSAAGLVMLSPDFGGLRIVPRPDHLPEPTAGLIRLSADQLDALSAGKLERSRRRVMGYLRETAPSETCDLDDVKLREQVLNAERSGNRLGLQSEAAHGQWAFLMLTTGGQIEEGELVRRAVRDAPDPDRAITELMSEMVRLSRIDVA